MLDPLFDLTGKIALVTGGSRGLGLQMVRAFADRGADCVIASPSSSFTNGALVRVDGGMPIGQ